MEDLLRALLAAVERIAVAVEAFTADPPAADDARATIVEFLESVDPVAFDVAVLANGDVGTSLAEAALKTLIGEAGRW